MKIVFNLLFSLVSIFLYAQEDKAEETFYNYELKSINSLDYVNTVKEISSNYSSILLHNWNLQLKASHIFTSDYRSIDQNGISLTSLNKRAIPLTGYNVLGGSASLTFGDGFIFGYIQEGDKTFFIEPYRYYNKLSSKDEYIIYEKADIKPTGTKDCGLIETESEITNRYSINNRSEGLCYEIEYAICNDYSMVLKYGSAAEAAMHAIGVTNNVNTLYDDEFGDEVTFLLSGQYTVDCNGCDPWSSTTNANQLLSSFKDWARLNLAFSPVSIPHDIASLWTNRDLDGNIVGIAYIGGACNYLSKYNVLQDFNNDANLKMVLAAHELGHNLNSYHDRNGTNFIMSPLITNTNTWSQESSERIEHFYNDADCFVVCPGYTPQVDFGRGTINVVESSQPSGYNTCLEPYFDVINTIKLSHHPEDSVIIELFVDSISTACESWDYDLFTSTYIFTPSGPIEFSFTIRIYNDRVEESDELLVIRPKIISGIIDSGTVMECTLSIRDVADNVSSFCCSDGGSFSYGTFSYSFSGIFLGFAEDAKTRIFFTASQLAAIGLTAGYIDQLSLFVQIKNSNVPFQSFRIGMKEVTEPEMTTTWYNTTEVFLGDVSTIEGVWNEFNFTQPFYWNGSSNLYIDFCFDNTTTSGKDYIIGFDPPESNVEYFSFRALNGTIGCDLNTGAYFYYYGRQPAIKFRKSIGAQIATQTTSYSSGNLKAGDIAHFYDDDDKIVATIKNMGYSNIGCIDVSINTSGPGQSNLSYGQYQYTNKTIEIDVENDSAYYELTTYFTPSELNIWGTEKLDLNFIKAEVPLIDAVQNNSKLIYAIESKTGIGTGNNISYRVTSRGAGYFGLANGNEMSVNTAIENSDFALSGTNKGILLKNMKGDSYLIHVDSVGSLISKKEIDPIYSSSLGNGNLILAAHEAGMLIHKVGEDYVKINIDVNGYPIAENISQIPINAVNLQEGNLAFLEPETGVIFQGSNGKCWQMIVDENGHIVCLEVSCKF